MKKKKLVHLLYHRKIGKEGIIPLGVWPGHDTGRIDAKNVARTLAKEQGKCGDEGLYEHTDSDGIWTLRLKDQAGGGAPVWVVRTTEYNG